MSSNNTYSWRDEQVKVVTIFQTKSSQSIKYLSLNVLSMARGVPVCPGPRSPLLIGPWLCQASRAASELLPEMTPHPTRLCVWAGSDPSPPPRLLPPRLLPLWTHKQNIKLIFFLFTQILAHKST